MRQKSSPTAEECLPPTEKRCNTTKAKVPRSQIASSADRVAARRTHVAVCRLSANARHLSSFWARREASAPPQVDTSTLPCQFSHGMNPPPRARWVQGGVHDGHVFTRASIVREALKFDLPLDTRRQDGRPLIRDWFRVARPSVLPCP